MKTLRTGILILIAIADRDPSEIFCQTPIFPISTPNPAKPPSLLTLVKGLSRSGHTKTRDW